MQKSNHKYHAFNIPVEELSNFINPINMSIFVQRKDLSSLFSNYSEIENKLNNYFADIFTYLPSMLENTAVTLIKNYCSITYTPHTIGYDFRLSPIDFINILFYIMKLDYTIPFINLDNGFGINYLKDCVRAYINDFNRDISQINTKDYNLKKEILNDLNENLDNIINMYNIDLNNLIKNNVVPKDMLLYLACKSLNRYQITNDERYIILPYEYYHYVSHMNSSFYPHIIKVSGNSMWYKEFRSQYETLYDSNTIVDDTPYLLSNDEVLVGWEILRPGVVDQELKQINEFNISNPNVDYAKYMELFQTKVNYFLSSPYLKTIKGKYSLLGYIGFSYKNEYLLFDKFHNSETINPDRKTILTHGEAIYGIPADRFTILTGTKQDILLAKKSDDRIKRVIHTPNNSFINKLDDIINGPNVSTLTFDEVIEKERKKMLIKN